MDDKKQSHEGLSTLVTLVVIALIVGELSFFNFILIWITANLVDIEIAIRNK